MTQLGQSRQRAAWALTQSCRHRDLARIAQRNQEVLLEAECKRRAFLYLGMARGFRNNDLRNLP